MNLDSRALYLLLVGLVAAERLVELAISRRNARAALAAGGREAGRRHYAAMVALHAGLLVAAPLEVFLLDRPFVPALGWTALGVLVGTMALRYWVVATLGPRWNTRVIVVPSAPLVTGGPYRWLRHPNYLAVILEGMALPLVHTAWCTALAFTLLDAWVLAVRIRVEEAALAEACGLPPALRRRPRLLPWRTRP